jgi:WD40 repeat protein
MRSKATVVLLVSLLVFVSLPARENKAGDQNQPDPVSFSKDIAPILAKKCLTCHGPEKSKGGLRLDTFEQLLKGGDSKSPAIKPGKPEESELYRLITTKDEDDRMPQKDDPLPANQIALIERWIKEGARFDGSDPKAALVSLLPKVPHPAPPEVYHHPVPVLAVAFNPAGDELAVGGYNEITIWNPSDGKLLRRIRNVAQRTHALSYSPDGSLLAAASGVPGQLGEVALFNPTTGEPLKVLATMPDIALSVSFSPDGTRLAAGGADNSIRIYDVASGKEQLLIQQHADWVMTVAWSHDNAHVASASRDRTARIYDAKTGELETTYTGHQGPVFAVTFNSDDKLVCSAGRDKKIHLWEAKDAKKTGELESFENDVFVLAVRGDAIFSCSADGNVREHLIGRKELIRTYAGHKDWVYALAVHEPTKRIATGGYDGEVRIWNIDDGKTLINFIAAPGYRPTVQTVRE